MGPGRRSDRDRTCYGCGGGSEPMREREAREGGRKTGGFLVIFLWLAGFGCAQRRSARASGGGGGGGGLVRSLRALPRIGDCLCVPVSLSLAAPAGVGPAPRFFYNSVPGSDGNSLGNRGGGPSLFLPVLRRVSFSFSELLPCFFIYRKKENRQILDFFMELLIAQAQVVQHMELDTACRCVARPCVGYALVPPWVECLQRDISERVNLLYS